MDKIDCPKCKGDGNFLTGYSVGFNVKNMEQYPVENLEICNHCDGIGLVLECCEECDSTLELDDYKDKYKEVFILCKECRIDFKNRNS